MTRTYTTGDEVDIDGTTITLIAQRGFRRDSGTRWSWHIPAADVYGEVSHPTAEAAVAEAHRTLGGPRCACGDPATMNVDNRRVCAAHA